MKWSDAHRPAPTGSLSRRLLWLTFGTVLLVQVLIFAPAVSHARRDWLAERLTYGQLAALSVSDLAAGEAADGMRPPDDLAARQDLLGLAGAESVRLMQPGKPPTVLGRIGMLEARHVIDLRAENDLAALGEAMRDLVGRPDMLVLVQAPGPVHPGSLVSVVFHSDRLTAHLRQFAGQVALLGLMVAAITGLFVNVALQAMLVRPMRRLTDSIAAFRADPERTPPLQTDALSASPGDEVAVAGRELAAMQRELRAALWRYARLAALGTAVAKVSHDLRSILAPALLAAERLESHPDAGARRIGDTVVRAVERATELVRGGLEFAREGPMTVNRRRFLLRGAAAEAGEQVRATCPRLALENRVEATLEVEADPDHIIRVLANLLRNAGEAGAERVFVDARAGPGDITLTVRDDGPGLPPKVIGSLFRPFVSGARRGSTGLGLAIARDLMRAHLGDIQLVSTGEGGTEFRLSLPATLSLKQTGKAAAVAV